ncbi:putative phytoene synthase [Trypanosoma conorhini]|uniref:Putative phytoene synthase n=1 Tax=Trypanosoma conorhini TaxID=83891 RepID=A0A422NUD3_9TRYP|nr:putative phytoene synthase [Trypanosoma conorhini]RNF09064.1 putative phytoene synthase [Trypanosoma conorhini]
MWRRLPLRPRHGGGAATATATATAARRAGTLGGGGGGPRPPRDEGISAGLRGFGAYGGSVAAFVRPPGERPADAAAAASPLPCGAAGPLAQAAKAQQMANIALRGGLPSPEPQRPSTTTTTTTAGSSSSSHASSLPQRLPPDGDAKAATRGTGPAAAAAAGAEAQEAADYYRAVPRNALSKEEMWRRITAASADAADRVASALQPSEADYLKMEEELRENDLFHYRMGEIAYPAATATRRSYYAMWQLAISLNKARWTMLDVLSQRGVKTTGAGMKLLFWKEAVNQIVERRQMTAGQFTDSHPVLRPFAAVVEQNPQLTRAFVRGFTDARLRVLQQPGNVKQLFDHFDRYYGYFFNALLEATGVKDEVAEHMLQHIGRAIGLTQHCVMFWKKYANVGFTMLPADLCADNYVNIALLKNISLASRDRAVRRLLYDVMCIAKTEMLHAQQLAPACAPTAWPVVMECVYANYYLGFLQRRDFNVSAMFADHNIENPGFAWYRVKKRWEWERHQSIARLVAEEAPLPFLGLSLGHGGSRYKMASGIGRAR